MNTLLQNILLNKDHEGKGMPDSAMSLCYSLSENEKTFEKGNRISAYDGTDDRCGVIRILACSYIFAVQLYII